MDWFTWLSRTRLETPLVYEYGIVFSNNELEEEDIEYFNHEFLQSMGISIAKHRLEIIKLATKEHKSYVLRKPLSKILLVLKNTKKSLAHYISNLVHHSNDNDKALVVVPSEKKSIKNNNNEKAVKTIKNGSTNGNYDKQEILMLTNGDYMSDYDPMIVSTPKLDCYSSPLMYDLQQSSRKEENVVVDDDDDEHDQDDEYWSPTVEEIRWDAMFQDLKPT